MVIRILIGAAVIWAAVVLYRRIARARQARLQTPAASAKVVKCAHCNVYVPREEAVESNGRAYCSEAHRLADDSE